MPESWMSQQVRCPFFGKESKTKHSIVCEGPRNRTTVHLHFARESERLRWLGSYCTDWQYKSCPLYKVAAEKYEER